MFQTAAEQGMDMRLPNSRKCIFLFSPHKHTVQQIVVYPNIHLNIERITYLNTIVWNKILNKLTGRFINVRYIFKNKFMTNYKSNIDLNTPFDTMERKRKERELQKSMNELGLNFSNSNSFIGFCNFLSFLFLSTIPSTP
jgi:hypothetical protein